MAKHARDESDMDDLDTDDVFTKRERSNDVSYHTMYDDPEPSQPEGDAMAFRLFTQLVSDQNLTRDSLYEFGLIQPNKTSRWRDFQEKKRLL